MARNNKVFIIAEEMVLEECDDLKYWNEIFSLNSTRNILLIFYFTVFVLCTRVTIPFQTGVMDPLIGNCVYQLLTIEELSTLPTVCIILLFMVLRINSDYFVKNVACVMGIQGVYRCLFYCWGEIYVWSGQQWASEILLLFDAW
jgi:hypothetical protein